MVYNWQGLERIDKDRFGMWFVGKDCLKQFWNLCCHHSFQIHLCWQRRTSFLELAYFTSLCLWNPLILHLCTVISKNVSLRVFTHCWKCIGNKKIVLKQHRYSYVRTALWENCCLCVLETFCVFVFLYFMTICGTSRFYCWRNSNSKCVESSLYSSCATNHHSEFPKLKMNFGSESATL